MPRAKYDLDSLEHQVKLTREGIAGLRGSAHHDLTVWKMRNYINKVDWLCKLVRRLEKKIKRLEQKH